MNTEASRRENDAREAKLCSFNVVLDCEYNCQRCLVIYVEFEVQENILSGRSIFDLISGRLEISTA